MKRLCLLLAFFCAALLFFPASAHATAFESLTYGGRDHLVYRPASLAAANKPLLIFLHGGGGNARHVSRSADFRDVADKNGFMVVYLNGNEGVRPITKNMRTWNGGGECCGAAAKRNDDDVSYISGFIQHMIRTEKIDPRRIFIGGHSNGAVMSYRFVCEKTDMVAGVIGISGTLLVDRCAKTKIRALHIHGENDDRVFVQGGKGPAVTGGVNFTSVTHTQKMLEQAGARVTVMLVGDAGHALQDVSDKLKKETGKDVPETVAAFMKGQ